MAHPEPHRGDPAPSSFLFESRLGGFLHAPLWAGIESSRFSTRITQERSVKPLGPDLIGGGIMPYLILWRGTCSSWLSPLNGDPSSNQILTQHFDAQCQTVSQLNELVDHAY
jgi:hypothetical protein